MRIVLRRNRRGFSLGEILVAVMIVAVVAAVVIPTVASQVQKADPQSVGNTALAVRGAVEQFLSDVRRYPLSFSQLTKAPAAGTIGLVGGNYATTEILRWAGPYLQKDSIAALGTASGLSFDPNFKVDTLGVTGLSETTATNPVYLTLCIAMDSLSALAVDRMFDDGDLTTGAFRWTVNTAGTTDTLKFLVVPIQ
jgi:prepilin-type N-terminal cleavage/methylation domain-containing protein